MEQQSITNKILPMIKSIFIVDKEKTPKPIFIAYYVLLILCLLQAIYFMFHDFFGGINVFIIGFIGTRILCFVASKIFKDKKSSKSIFFFDKMITPHIVTFIYWLLLAGVVVAGIMTMFMDVMHHGIQFRYMGFPTIISILSGLLQIIIGGTFVRLWSEFMMVFFKINENLQFLREAKEKELERK